MDTGQASQTSGTAIASLVFGVLSWVMLPLLGAILAVIFGHIARAEIRRATLGQIEGDGIAVAGLILGWLHLIIVILAVCIVLIVFGGIAAFLATIH